MIELNPLLPPYRAKGDVIRVKGTVSILSGSKDLEVLGANFVLSDEGKMISVPGAGPASINLVSTIDSVIDAEHVELHDFASYALASVSNDMIVSYGTDDSNAIQFMFDDGAASGLPLRGLGLKYGIKSGLILDASRTVFDGEGTVFDASFATNITAFTFLNGGLPDNNESVLAVLTRPSRNFAVIGDFRGSGHTVTGFAFSGTSDAGAAALTLDNIVALYCGKGIDLSGADAGPGLTDLTINRLRVLSSYYGVYASGNREASENVRLNNGFIVNCPAALAYIDTINMDLNLYGCSLDGSAIGILSHGSDVRMFGGHMEAISGHYVDVTGSAHATLQDVSIALSNSPRSTPMFGGTGNTSPVSTIQLDGCSIGKFGSVVNNMKVACEDGVRFIVNGSQVSNQAIHPIGLFSDTNNGINNGHFNSSNISGWTVDSGTVSHDSTDGYTSNGCLKLTAAGGGPNTITHYRFLCRPGEFIAAQAWAKTEGLSGAGGNARFIMELSYLDYAGNGLGGAPSNIETTTEISDWTNQQMLAPIATSGYAPAGTFFGQLKFYAQSGTNAWTAKIDDVFTQVS